MTLKAHLANDRRVGAKARWRGCDDNTISNTGRIKLSIESKSNPRAFNKCYSVIGLSGKKLST